MPSFSTARAAVKARLDNITGLNAYATAPGTPNLPAAIVLPGSPPIVYDEVMSRGADRYNFDVLVLVNASATQLAQDKLDAYLAGTGDTSIKTVIEADERLGGEADWTRVVAVTQYGDVEYGGNQYLGARLAVEVSATMAI
jgi:hypothetical protein